MHKILIIDEDQELTDLLVEFLSDFKYETVVFHCPLEGLKYLKKNSVDFILLDFMLPEMDYVKDCDFLSENIHEMQKLLPVIERTFAKWNLKVNQAKTEFVTYDVAEKAGESGKEKWR